jgi:hypothetical protein
MRERRIQEISHDIIKNCYKKRNIFVVDEDIEIRIKDYPELNEEDIHSIKQYLNNYVIFTTYD